MTIRKLGPQKYQVTGKGGRKLGTYRTKAAAQKRLRQAEYWKGRKGKG